jgi:hypothetical protein
METIIFGAKIGIGIILGVVAIKVLFWSIVIAIAVFMGIASWIKDDFK